MLLHDKLAAEEAAAEFRPKVNLVVAPGHRLLHEGRVIDPGTHFGVDPQNAASLLLAGSAVEPEPTEADAAEAEQVEPETEEKKS